MKDLLVELGVEELPHAICKITLEDFFSAFTEELKKERIEYGEPELMTFKPSRSDLSVRARDSIS